MKLVATKSLSYATRRMQAGDEFDAKPTDAKILIKLGKAKDGRRVPGELPPPPPSVASKISPLVEAAPKPPAEAPPKAEVKGDNKEPEKPAGTDVKPEVKPEIASAVQPESKPEAKPPIAIANKPDQQKPPEEDPTKRHPL